MAKLGMMVDQQRTLLVVLHQVDRQVYGQRRRSHAALHTEEG